MKSVAAGPLRSLLSPFLRKSQKTRQSTVQEINGVQSWISPPPLTAPKHYKTSILGAVIVSERGSLEPPFFPERRVAGLLAFAQFRVTWRRSARVTLSHNWVTLILSVFL